MIYDSVVRWAGFTTRVAQSLFFLLLVKWLILSSPAIAEGAGIAWDDCLDRGTSSLVFDCAQNLGKETFIIWFSPLGGLPAVAGAEAFVQVAFTNDVMPSWWQLKGISACRDSALQQFVDFEGRDRCLSYWTTGAYFGFDYFPDNSAPGRMSLGLVVGQPGPARAVLSEFASYYGFRIVVDHRKTTGAGACDGCSSGVSLILKSFKLQFEQSPEASLSITPPGAIAWQGGRVPIRSTSWGSIKDLYR